MLHKMIVPFLFLLNSCAAMPAMFQAVDDIAKEEQSCKVQLDKEMLQQNINYEMTVKVTGSPTSTK